MIPRWLCTACVCALMLLAAACRNGPPDDPPPPEDLGPDWFKDITKESGIDHAYKNGEEDSPHLAILESLGGGIALLDYDGDGLPDVFIPGGGRFAGKDRKTLEGRPCKLYRNLGGGKFKDATKEAGLESLAGGAPWFYTHGAAAADYDRDGFPDLLVTGWGRVALFKNVPVDPKDPKKGRRFVDASKEAKLDKATEWTTSAAWGDLDGDGYPDLYLCQYVDWSWTNNPEHKYDGVTRDVAPPKKFSGLDHKVFRNHGDGTFDDVSATAGLKREAMAEAQKRDPRADKYNPMEQSKGLGVLMADFDGDGKPDV
ncbi:MAG: VCBS repeat-containing protein, partial [Gemmataceae bacterium]|nr:VCBS repeat-containing protein [Gemmataceae bacterium]